jgi:hypothetical protein
VTLFNLTSCVQFCGYHSFTQVNQHNLYYAVIPDFKDAACNSICFENPQFGWQQQQQRVESHEIAETLTDGDFNGWVDRNQPAACGDEIGDICNGQSANITSWNDWNTTVTVQKEWSNSAYDCVTGDQTPSIESIVPDSGPRAGGQMVTITGARFVPGNTSFWFGTAQAAVVNCTSTTTCTVTTPAANPVFGPSVTVGVKAIVNGLASSWDDVRDDYRYLCGPMTAAQACGGNVCGPALDGCGGTLSCGGCSLGYTCATGSCVRKCATGFVNCDGKCVKPNFCS